MLKISSFTTFFKYSGAFLLIYNTIYMSSVVHTQKLPNFCNSRLELIIIHGLAAFGQYPYQQGKMHKKPSPPLLPIRLTDALSAA